VAPIIVAEGWKESYRELFKTAAAELNGRVSDLTFEFITHRFTKKAKGTILEVFPNTRLDLEEEARTFKFGQFGGGKYVYQKELFYEIKTYFEDMTGEFFTDAKVEYFV